MATYTELKAQAEALLKQAEAARRAEIVSVVAEIQGRMKEYGITLEDLKSGAKKARTAVAAKYRNSATGESWSGRGRAPKWLAEEMAKGRSKDAFVIKNG